MKAKPSERGATLIISMIMLVALTLLVVFAIRSGNANLLIAGNAQVQVEASAAVQQSIEHTLEKIVTVENPSVIPAQDITVKMGAKTYQVKVDAMKTCLMELPVDRSTLKNETNSDAPCNGDVDPGGMDMPIGADGNKLLPPSECSQQVWEVKARVDDFLTGAKVEQGQGVNIRVPSYVSCPTI